MCSRWAHLDVKDFGSALPLGNYLKGPWSLQAIGDADGLIHKVFPTLGIDVAAIRASAKAGTFNVADFGEKRSVAFDNTEIDAELMAAGMSLPLFVTPLRRDGKVFTDAVWIRDANVAEALRRGATEVWLIWCIGNTSYWGDGPLEQYVHMIEMSAMGALLADFESAQLRGRDFVLHVIRPEHPLPLDPEFYLGRISADDLVSMGYRDARLYLAQRSASGVPRDARCTQMTDPPAGVRFSEHLTGVVGKEPIALHTVSVVSLSDVGRPGDAALTAPVEVRQPAMVAGYVDFVPWGERVFLAGGKLEFGADQITYRGQVRVNGTWLALEATRQLVDDPGFDAFSDATTVELTIGGGLRSTLRLSVRGMAKMLGSIEPVGVHGLLDHAEAVRVFAERVFRGALAAYL